MFSAWVGVAVWPLQEVARGQPLLAAVGGQGGGADVGVRFEDQTKLRMAARMSEVRRGGYDPDSKLADMDADGVDREVVYTTLGLQLWRLPDTALLQALFAAYNDWIAAFCATAAQRLAGVALVLLD